MPAHDLDLLIDAAKHSGEIARRYFREKPETWDKGGGQGPVTEADLEIDRMLKHTLLAARPDYGWLSEESTDTEHRLQCPRVFIIDPIDGTRSFVEGSKTFAHSLAVVEGNIVTAAVVFLPMRDMMYSAKLGCGAFLNGVALRHSGRDTLDQARVLAARPQFAPELWPGGVPQVDRHFRPSLAYRLGLVAEGRFDAMVTLRDAWEWDIAAGALLCQEAGAAISDRSGDTLRFNNPNPKHPGVLAGSPAVHAAILGHLSKKVRSQSGLS